MNLSVTISPTLSDHISHLPAIERSAARAFLAIPDLADLATGPVIDEAVHRRYQARGDSLVAVQGSTPVGFALVEPLDDALFIVELSVCRDLQGRGIGKGLLNAAVSHARMRGNSAVTLTTFREVPWNAPYYARCGFKIIEEAALTPGLAQKLAEEAAHGLPQEKRCAMRLALV